MNMRRPALSVPALLAGLLCGGLAALAAEDDRLHWLSNYDEAIREARRTQKPIFLEFRCEP